MKPDMTEEFMTPEVSEMASRLTGETAKKTVEQIERERDCVGTKPLILIMDSQGRVHRFESDPIGITCADDKLTVWYGEERIAEFTQWQWWKSFNFENFKTQKAP